MDDNYPEVKDLCRDLDAVNAYLGVIPKESWLEWFAASENPHDTDDLCHVLKVHLARLHRKVRPVFKYQVLIQWEHGTIGQMFVPTFDAWMASRLAGFLIQDSHMPRPVRIMTNETAKVPVEADVDEEYEALVDGDGEDECPDCGMPVEECECEDDEDDEEDLWDDDEEGDDEEEEDEEAQWGDSDEDLEGYGE
jgi:hypothetical protein